MKKNGFTYEITYKFQTIKKIKTTSIQLDITLNNLPEAYKEYDTFVYEVQVEREGEIAYDDIISIPLNGNANASKIIDGIPVGYKVKATCRYFNYKYNINNMSVEAETTDPEIATLAFYYDYTEENNTQKNITNLAFDFESGGSYKLKESKTLCKDFDVNLSVDGASIIMSLKTTKDQIGKQIVVDVVTPKYIPVGYSGEGFEYYYPSATYNVTAEGEEISLRCTIAPDLKEFGESFKEDIKGFNVAFIVQCVQDE